MALVGGSRQYPVHTKLGRIMEKRGLRAYQVAADAGIYVRSMTEYLAGRKKPTPRNMAKLAEHLGVGVPDLTEKKYPWLKEDQENLQVSQAVEREREHQADVAKMREKVG